MMLTAESISLLLLKSDLRSIAGRHADVLDDKLDEC